MGIVGQGRGAVCVGILVATLLAGCAPAPPPAPTKPVAPTPAPPASSPVAKPGASPAASPAASPGAAAQPAGMRSTARIDPSLASVWQGKTITLVVAENPGGGYDNWARLTGRHLNRFLPGQPNLIVENMPGGSHRIGMNHIYASKPDGLTLGMVERYVPSYQLRGEGPEQGVRYDITKVHWIGAPTRDTQALTVHKRKGITDWKQILDREVVLAQSGIGGPPNTWTVILKDALGLKLRPIFGFAGSAAQLLSIDRGETDGILVDWSSIKVQRGELVRDKTLIPLIQLGSGLEELTREGVPLAADLFKGKSLESEQMRLFAQLPFDRWSRAVLTPPGMDPRVVETLRAAYWQMVADPTFIAEAEKLNFTVEPTPGEIIQDSVAEYMRTPRSVIEKLDALLTAQEE